MSKAQVMVRLDKRQLARAKKALGAETITEAIEQALALATEKTTHDAIVRKYDGLARKSSSAER